jgi:HEPN domain-containing protein
MSDSNLVQDWFRHSNNDFIVAKHSFEDLYPKQIEISSYLCQQCAEKSLKGYLAFKDVDPPHKHDLQLLNRLCIEKDISFKALEMPCALLNKYSVITRYPNELETDEVTAKAAIERAKLIYDFCFAKISTVNVN